MICLTISPPQARAALLNASAKSASSSLSKAGFTSMLLTVSILSMLSPCSSAASSSSTARLRETSFM
ncbi:MAG: hypothetical protein BWY99_02167 [Synergistetes bacterium ADurb.BinA166]|nr:MAG: hypothetical protein BWY99_02167 [Synergistetes bacterium ADurb.BinA166]